MKHVHLKPHLSRASGVSQFRATARMNCVSFSDLLAGPRRLRSGRCFPLRMNVIPRRSDAAVTLVTLSGNLQAAKTDDPDALLGAAFRSDESAKCKPWRRFPATHPSRAALRATRVGHRLALASRLLCVCMKVPRIAP